MINNNKKQDDNTSKNNIKKPKTSNQIPKRCQEKDCRNKIKIMHFKCKCDKYFCINHCNSEKHSCTFDYYADNQKKIEENMVDSNFKKIDKI